MTLEILEVNGNRPLPIELSEITRPFWEGLEQGVFQTTKCLECKKIMFPPKAICPKCLSRELEWQSIRGDGVLYSYTTIHAAPPMFSAQKPLRVAIVDLEEGLRLVCRLLGTDEPVLNSPVRLVVSKYDDGSMFAARSNA